MKNKNNLHLEVAEYTLSPTVNILCRLMETGNMTTET